MNQVPNMRGPLGLKQSKAKPDRDRIQAIKGMRCIICQEWGLPQISETQAHHCIMGRYGQRRTPDTHTIPLCEGHHQGLRDKTKVAIHRSPDAWRRLFGEDVDWLPVVNDILAGERT